MPRSEPGPAAAPDRLTEASYDAVVLAAVGRGGADKPGTLVGGRPLIVWLGDPGR
jgi:hypothetical protein